MSNTDQVLSYINVHPGCTDTQIRVALNIEPHQQVNQIARALEKRGLTTRTRGASGLIVNTVAARPLAPSNDESSQPAPTRSAPTTLPLPGSDTLVVLPCSATKVRGGLHEQTGPKISASLPTELADALEAARATVAPGARIDTSGGYRRAMDRYAGRLYSAAHPALERYVNSGATVVIISGGFGAVLAEEQIPYYDLQLRPRAWPPGLIAKVIAAHARAIGASQVLAFAAMSTGYRKVLTETVWPSLGIGLTVVSAFGDGAGTGTTPSALGSAFAAWVDQSLTADWRSLSGLALDISSL